MKTTPLNLKQIQAFRAVMVTGTTLEAGRLLHISQPAVSRLITGIESASGVKLFERKQGRLRPTQKAEALLEEVEKTFAGLDRIASLLQTDDGSEAMHMHIVATTPMAHGLLPWVLASFRSEHPNVSVSVQIVIRRELRAYFDRQHFDIALSSYPLDYPEDASAPLSKSMAVCVLPQGHKLAGRKALSPSDLADEHFISMPLETGARQKTDVLFQRMGVARRFMSEGQNGIMICQMVAAGLGVSIVDPFSARVFARDIVRVPLRPPIWHEFRFFFPLQRPLAPLTSAFAEVARRVARDMLDDM